MRQTAAVKVFEVLHDGAGDGPAGDGTYIYRSGNRRTAEAFAKENTCYGRPATVRETEASRRLAQRWGI